MRKVLTGLALSLLVLGGTAALLGVTPHYVATAPGIGGGIGAKLLCSAVYVSGFDKAQAFADLEQYSPLLRYLDVEYNDSARSVQASLFGMGRTTARYLPGLGCANEYPGETARDTLQPQPLVHLDSRWPHGNRVDSIAPDTQALIESIVAEDNLEDLNTRALLVVHQGQIVAEAYAQGAGPNTPLIGWSMSKSLTSVMLGNLVLRGKLDLNQRPVFAQWAQDNRRDISLRDMLRMSDGLAFSERYSPGDDVTLMLFTQASATDYAMARPLEHPPGVHFNYSSGTANLLARVYYDHTGSSLQTAYDDFTENIALPLSFQDAVFETDAEGVFVGSSYFYASARDWARLGQLMLNGGEINGRRVISEDWVAQSTAPNPSENNRAYGYQWWLNGGGDALRWPDLSPDVYAAQGNRQQVLMVLPSQEMVIVRLGWTSGSYPINERMARIAESF